MLGLGGRLFGALEGRPPLLAAEVLPEETNLEEGTRGLVVAPVMP